MSTVASMVPSASPPPSPSSVSPPPPPPFRTYIIYLEPSTDSPLRIRLENASSEVRDVHGPDDTHLYPPHCSLSNFFSLVPQSTYNGDNKHCGDENRASSNSNDNVNKNNNNDKVSSDAKCQFDVERVERILSQSLTILKAASGLIHGEEAAGIAAASELGQIGKKLGQFDTKLGQLDENFGQLDGKLGQLPTRPTKFDRGRFGTRTDKCTDKCDNPSNPSNIELPCPPPPLLEACTERYDDTPTPSSPMSDRSCPDSCCSEASTAANPNDEDDDEGDAADYECGCKSTLGRSGSLEIRALPLLDTMDGHVVLPLSLEDKVADFVQREICGSLERELNLILEHDKFVVRSTHNRHANVEVPTEIRAKRSLHVSLSSSRRCPIARKEILQKYASSLESVPASSWDVVVYELSGVSAGYAVHGPHRLREVCRLAKVAHTSATAT